MWWIKAATQEYVLRSWSLVKMGTNSAQKTFFNLKKIKNQIARTGRRFKRRSSKRNFKKT